MRARAPGQQRPQSGRLALSELLDVELECIEGLEDVAADEASGLSTNAVAPIVRDRSVLVCVASLDGLTSLRCPLAAYVIVSRSGAKPTVLVGDSSVGDACAEVLSSHPDGTFTTFGIDMPGRDSPAARRIREAVAERTGLRYEKERGQLLVRCRRSKDGWQALVRLTPKPLSTRPWRTRSVQGAVNACIAASMVRLLAPSADDVFGNLMCGSGTIAIERALAGPAKRIVAADVDPAMTTITREHAQAAGVDDRVEVIEDDALGSSFADETFDRLAAVLPYGFRIGSHGENLSAYPAMLSETARVSAPGARLALLTQELKLLDETIAAQRVWRQVESRRIWQGGHRPNLALLERA